jgi:hypothetical protein
VVEIPRIPGLAERELLGAAEGELGQVSLPSRIAPAAFKREIVVASSVGTWCSRSRDPDVVRTPAVSN